MDLSQMLTLPHPASQARKSRPAKDASKGIRITDQTTTSTETSNKMLTQATVALHEQNHPYSELLERVLRRLLGLSATQLAVAELMDDMPIRDHYFCGKILVHPRHPEIEHRLRPSDQAMEVAFKLCQILEPQTFPVDPQVSFLPNFVMSKTASIFINDSPLLCCRPPKFFRTSWNCHIQAIRPLYAF